MHMHVDTCFLDHKGSRSKHESSLCISRKKSLSIQFAIYRSGFELIVNAHVLEFTGKTLSINVTNSSLTLKWLLEVFLAGQLEVPCQCRPLGYWSIGNAGDTPGLPPRRQEAARTQLLLPQLARAENVQHCCASCAKNGTKVTAVFCPKPGMSEQGTSFEWNRNGSLSQATCGAGCKQTQRTPKTRVVTFLSRFLSMSP